MSDRHIVENCSPVLAGLKAGSLFSVEYRERKDIDEDIRRVNRILVKKGLRALPMRYGKRRTLIYLYRPDRLRKDLSVPAAIKILEEKGYPVNDEIRCLSSLLKRIRSQENFPHEIGLFLGYPPEDVSGFMRSPYEGVKCVGCWKVYGNREEAEKTFSRYRKCTEIYRKALERGRTLEELTIGTG